MSKKILLLGFSDSVLSDAQQQLVRPDLEVFRGKSVEDVRSRLLQTTIDHVFIGGKLAVETHLENRMGSPSGKRHDDRACAGSGAGFSKEARALFYSTNNLESALCYGWIDGQKASFDDRYWLQKFTPRRPKSIWSRINCEKATALIAQGRMHPAGLRQVELAKADGRWEQAYGSQSKITIPADFQSELDKNPQAQAFFSTLDSANRYAILFRIETAKRTETRTARIQKFIEMLSKGEKIHP